jgi:hypothetical protein
MSNNWKKVKENLCKKADAMKAKAADFPGYKCPLSRTQMRQGFHRSRCRSCPEIAILEADPEE